MGIKAQESRKGRQEQRKRDGRGEGGGRMRTREENRKGEIGYVVFIFSYECCEAMNYIPPLHALYSIVILMREIFPLLTLLNDSLFLGRDNPTSTVNT